MLYSIFKHVAFRIDPELIHNITAEIFHYFPTPLAFIIGGMKTDDARYGITSNGLHWSFPVGLAAGLDKEAYAIVFYSKIGFGSVEAGTVTPVPQKGNPKPRIFRYIKENSFRNHMGFPNSGMEKIYSNLQAFSKVPAAVGMNLGKNNETPEKSKQEDYLVLYKKFASLCDFLVINISCPNVPDLKKLQASKPLTEILTALENERKINPTKLFVKISPDLTPNEISGIVEVAKKFNLDGLVATNTRVMPDRGRGGISGRLLYEKANKVRNQLLEETREIPNFDVIGVGGIDNFDQILDFWKRGGKFVQIYTSFIYQGPKILKEIKKGIDQIIKKEQASSLQELFDANYFINL